MPDFRSRSETSCLVPLPGGESNFVAGDQTLVLVTGAGNGKNVARDDLIDHALTRRSVALSLRAEARTIAFVAYLAGAEEVVDLPT